MLVLQRKEQQGIRLALSDLKRHEACVGLGMIMELSDIKIKVLKIQGANVKLAIEAPKLIPIDRLDENGAVEPIVNARR